MVQDTKQSDFAALSIAVIGGADGPTSVFLLSNGSSRRPHSACSALTFEPAEEVEWKAAFREKPCEDFEIDLL